MPSKELTEAEATVVRALKLLDSETADEIIGEVRPEEYDTMIQAVQAAYHMIWVLAKSNGMRQTKEILKMGAQAQAVLLTLVHYAYALGIRRGRQGGD